jgi:hypothetical protein
MKKETIIIIEGRSVSPAFIELVTELVSYVDIGGDNKIVKNDLFEVMHDFLFYYEEDSPQGGNMKKFAKAAAFMYYLIEKIELLPVPVLITKNEKLSN